MLNDIKVLVSEEVYKAYWKITNRERYLKRLDLENRLIYFSTYDTTNNTYIENISDNSFNLEKEVIMRDCFDKLYITLSKLEHDEMQLVNNIYFNEMSIRECARFHKVSSKKILTNRKKF